MLMPKSKEEPIEVNRPHVEEISHRELTEWDRKFLRENWTFPFGTLMNNAPKCAKMTEYVKQVKVLHSLALSLSEEVFVAYSRKEQRESVDFKANGKGNKSADDQGGRQVTESKSPHGSAVVQGEKNQGVQNGLTLD
jgi:hypothetical protein